MNKVSVVLLLTIACFNLNFFFSQMNSCLSKQNLLYLQKSSIPEGRVKLNQAGYSFAGAKSDIELKYFYSPLKYDVTYWNGPYSTNINLYNYIGKSNIIEIQNSNYCFNNLLREFSSQKGNSRIDGNSMITEYFIGDIYFEFTENNIDYEGGSNKVLIYKNSDVDLQLAVIEEENQIRKEKYKALISEADELFEKAKYIEAKRIYSTAQNLANGYDDWVYSRVRECNKMVAYRIIEKADSLIKLNDYKEAKTVLNEYTDYRYGSTDDIILKKIEFCNKKILDKEIENMMLDADSNYKKEKFDEAIELYRNVLNLDPNFSEAQEKLKLTKEVKKIHALRATTIFKYSITNSNEFLQLKDNFAQQINRVIDGGTEGYLGFDLKIIYDTTGQNKSYFNWEDRLSEDIKFSFEQSAKQILKPAESFGYYLMAEDDLKMNLSWSSNEMKCRSNYRGINFDGEENMFTNALKKYVTDQPFDYGKYVFEVKSKQLNDNRQFFDIDLKKYKVNGPESALLSMLMPGMGTLRVTYGKKGWIQFSSFIFCTGISLGTMVYSSNQYEKYKNSINQSDMDKFYDKANVSHKISLISGGLSASIYLYDIFWVFGKGFKNLNESKSTRKRVNRGGELIQYQKIIF